MCSHCWGLWCALSLHVCEVFVSRVVIRAGGLNLLSSFHVSTIRATSSFSRRPSSGSQLGRQLTSTILMVCVFGVFLEVGTPTLHPRLPWAVCIHRTRLCMLCGGGLWQVLQTGMSSWLMCLLRCCLRSSRSRTCIHRVPTRLSHSGVVC
jgi:hypothetical protein